MTRKRRVAVTGCSGFIGVPLVRELAAQDIAVVGIDRELPPPDLPLENFLQVDLAEHEAVALVSKSLRGTETIFHLAAARADWGVRDTEYIRDNVTATETVLEASQIALVDDLIHFSTVGVLPRTMTPLTEDARPNPETVYGQTKLDAERLIHRATQDNAFRRAFILRPSAVFGINQPSNTNIYRLMDAMLKKRFIMVGDGKCPKTTSFLDNTIAAALWGFWESPTGCTTWHYVDYPVLTTNALAQMVADALNLSQPRLRIPLSLARVAAIGGDLFASLTGHDVPITSARVKKFCTPTNFSSSKIRKAGFQQPVAIEEALSLTAEWQRAE